MWMDSLARRHFQLPMCAEQSSILPTASASARERLITSNCVEEMGVCGAYCAMHGRLRRVVVVCLDTSALRYIPSAFSFLPICLHLCSIVHGKSPLALRFSGPDACHKTNIIPESHAHELTNRLGMCQALHPILTRTKTSQNCTIPHKL